MKSDWEIFDEILTERGIPRQVMIYPERYMDQYNVTRRKSAIIEMHKRGISKGSLTALCPYTMRHLDRILNGTGASREQEADVNADNPPETEHPLGSLPTQ